MTNNSPKHIAFKTLLKYKLCVLDNYTDLRRIIESNQFTIIDYKKHANSKPVTELIKRLGVEKETLQNDSFLYIKNNLKFVFINADISDEDKCSLLRHELGHICDPDLKTNSLQNSVIKREEFANEFSFYTKKPGIIFKFYLLMIKKRKLFAGIIALIAFVLGLAVMINTLLLPPAKPVTGDASIHTLSGSTYYVTSAGKKYHRKNCITIKYKNNLTEVELNEAINKGYKPCMVCNPEE